MCNYGNGCSWIIIIVLILLFSGNCGCNGGPAAAAYGSCGCNNGCGC